MSAFRRTVYLTAVNVRSIPRRMGSSLVIVVGVAGVVAVLISVLAMASGFQRTIRDDGREDRAIVMTRGAETEAASSLSRESVAAILAAAGIRRESGDVIASADVLLVAPVARRRDGSDAHVTLRGVGPAIQKLRPEIRLIAGRMFQPAVHEVIVGVAAQSQFKGLQIGEWVRLQDGDWTIVGVFSTNGSLRESEILADAQTVLSAYKETAFNSVTVALESRSATATLEKVLGADPKLIVDVRSEPAYLATASKSIRRLLEATAYAIGGIMVVGALFGALNTMYSSVAARGVEIATMRALGFSPLAVLISVLVEALLLSLVGAVSGVAVAYAAFNGRAISTLGGAVWDSQLVYSLTLTPAVVSVAVGLACAIGLFGGLIPGLRAARLPVAEALRAI